MVLNVVFDLLLRVVLGAADWLSRRLPVADDGETWEPWL